MPSADRPTLHLQTTAGQPLLITLDAAPGAGLLWQAPDAPAGCKLAAGTNAAAGAGDGGAVQQRFNFTAQAAGTHTLRFELRRDWEAKAQAEQLVTVKVLSAA